jgi:hypothetical protein
MGPHRDRRDCPALRFRSADGNELVGRIFKVGGAAAIGGNWRWSMVAMGPHLRRPHDSHGIAKTKAEAVELVTECYAVSLAAAE